MLPRATDDQGRIVELCGEPGIGKTRLLRLLAARARSRGLPVFHFRSAEIDQRIAFCSISQALGHAVITRACAGMARPAVDILRTQVLSGAARDPLTDAAAAHAVFPVLRRLLVRVAAKGAVLLLDDFHLADRRSIAFVEFLTQASIEAPLLIVLAQRPRQTPDGLRSAIMQGTESGTVERLNLRPLTIEQSARVLAATPHQPGLGDLHARSRGIPLYLLALAGHSPEQLAARLGGELASLSRAEAVLLRAGAVLGDEFPIDVAGVVAGVDGTELCAATAGLQRRDLLRAGGEPATLSFRHQVLRDVVYSATEPCWRASAHRRAFTQLARRRSPASVLAEHIARCPAEAVPADVPVLRQAADRVMADRPADAARWLRLGVTIAVDEPAVLRELRGSLVNALIADGLLAEAREVLVELIGSIDSADQRAGLVTTVALVECLLGRYPEANTALSAELGRDPTPAAVVRLVMRKAVVGLFGGDLPSSEELARLDAAAAAPACGRAADAAERLAAAGAYALRGLCAGYAGEVAEARRLIIASGSILDSTGDAELEAYPDCLTVLGWAETLIARLDDARRHLGRQRSICLRQPTSPVLPVVLMGLSWAHHCSAQLTDARRTAAEAKEAARRLGASQCYDLAVMIETAYLSWVNRDGGQLAVEQAERAVAVRLPRNWWFGTNAMLLLAQALIMNDEADRGRAVILAAGGGHDLPFVSPVIRPWCFEALADIAAGQCDPAAEGWARRAQAAASAIGQLNHDGFALLARAHVLRGRAEHEGAASLYRQAARLFAALGMTGAQIRSLNHAARCANSAGQPSEAMSDLLLARELARQCDASVVVEDSDIQRRQLAILRARPRQPSARETGRRTGASQASSARSTRSAPPESAPPPGPSAELSTLLATLTQREAEIARIAATGQRTREIAAALRLSPRTVDVHLSRIYRKFGVTSRAKLVRLMAQLA